MISKNTIAAELAVIGCGASGMAASLFAVNRGVEVVQVGGSGMFQFTSGLLDLMGTHPIESNQKWQDPWAGIRALVQDLPHHPYGHLPLKSIAVSMAEVFSFLKEQGLYYRTNGALNSDLLTPLGSTKTTYGVPGGMWQGVAAWEAKTPCLLVGFEGLPGFSAAQIVNRFQKQWPDIRAIQIPFPGEGKNSRQLVTGEMLAYRLENKTLLEKIARKVTPHLQDAQAVGFPAVLGMYAHPAVLADLAKMIGAPCFEIPTLPVSVPGLRLKHVFSQGLIKKGLHQLSRHEVTGAKITSSNDFLLDVRCGASTFHLRTKGVILATGRFLSGGLHADRGGIRETIFNLPVMQPSHRREWHRRDFFDPHGHPINRTGLATDGHFRPLDKNGQPLNTQLRAVGTILAHQDWMRMGCGAGVAFASAYGAVESWMAAQGANLLQTQAV